MNVSPLRIVVLTPPGRGAVATVRVEGACAAEHVDRFFRPVSQRPVADLAEDRLAFGRFELGEEVHDEVVVRRPKTDAVEIHCHGGPAVVERMIAVLSAGGGQRISPQDWLRTTHASPIVAAAHAALGNATTLRAASILLDQYHGALDHALRGILQQLDGGDIQSASAGLDELLRVADCGCHLTKPWRVVLAGEPNVGKSSLINALVGYERAIVHETPGTTRDLVTAKTALDGWPVEFCDTAGLRKSDHAVEQQGIGLAQRQLESASLVVLVFDMTRPWREQDSDLCWRFPAALRVFNKVDAAPEKSSERPGGHPVSATEREGIDDLIQAIANRLVPAPPVSGQAAPFLAEQAHSLAAAWEALKRNRTGEAIERIAGLLG